MLHVFITVLSAVTAIQYERIRMPRELNFRAAEHEEKLINNIRSNLREVDLIDA